MDREMLHLFLISLRLPGQRDLIDVLIPESHLLTARKTDPVHHPISLLRNAPERAIFHLGDVEVDGFTATGGGVLDDDSYDTAWEEEPCHLAGKNVAGPVCGLIHDDGSNCPWHWGALVTRQKS